jgi:RimJ/RimL family protein N-acetyltransferase
MPNAVWPLFDLRIRTPRLELRLPTDDDFPALLDVIHAGIHPPDTMPFEIPWTDAEGDELSRESMRFWWRSRGELTAEDWHLPFMVSMAGKVVGSQGVKGTGFPALREVETGSWVGMAYQGQGIGKEMRAAVLHFAFAGLGAEVARSGAWADNAASIAVSRALGYEDDGTRRGLRRDVPAEQVRFRMTREGWEDARADRRHPVVTLDGVGPCLALLGAA